MPSYKLSEIYNAFVRTRDMGAQNAADFPAASRGGKDLALIAAAASAIEAGSAVKESGAVSQQVVSKEIAAAAVMEDLRDVNATARAIAVDEPDFLELFRMPTGDSMAKLLAAAEAALANATAHKQKFLEFEMPADFLEDLQPDITALREAIEGKNQASGAQVGATASKDAAIKQGLDALRRLRASVRNKYRDSPEKRAAWESATRIKRSASSTENPPDEA